SQTFSGSASLSSGSNSVSVSATAGGGSGTTTNTHKLEVVGAGSATLTYDLNGNMTSDGTNSFAWDAENRLIQITYPSANNKTEFTYSPTGGRVKIVETVSGSVTSTKQFVGGEERDGSGNVTKQFFAQGQIRNLDKYFYGQDHLGSVRMMTDAYGVLQSAFSFEPYGRTTKLEGGQDSDFGFAGMYVHARSGLNLTAFRAYVPVLGRWLSKDPIGEAGGANLYAYVGNSPSSFIDMFGLARYFINQPEWANKLGHNGVIVGSGDGPYTYVSYGPKTPNAPFDAGIVDERTFSTLGGAFAFAASLGYKEYLAFSENCNLNDEANDKKALDAARTWRNTGYNVLLHNSDDFAVMVINASGGSITKAAHPNGTFLNARGQLNVDGGPRDFGTLK
ncbi:MAG: RHS repeat-associated core domain-containing protein, partial [Candidatus Obscuribacterales bacterium]